MANRMTLEQVNDALVRLTPGGSEFHDSPKNCLIWIKDGLSMTGKLAAERNRYRAAGDELAEIVAALENAASENRMDAFAISAAAALPGIKDALRRWREATS